MASNPLPPAPRFAGSVGIAAGPEIGIMDDDGNLLPRGALGEVVIRGRNVTAGYENNPDAVGLEIAGVGRACHRDQGHGRRQNNRAATHEF